MSIRKLLYLAAAWLLFAAAGPTFLRNESQIEVFRQEKRSSMVQPGIYKGTADLSQVSGEQVVGMIPYALAGEFPLTVDDISINSSTDITSVNLAGVPGLTYTLVVNRDAARNIVSVTANKN